MATQHSEFVRGYFILMKISVIGGGGFAGEVIDALLAGTAPSAIKIVGVFDDDTRLSGGLVHGFAYGGKTQDFIERTPPQSKYVLAIGDNSKRQRLAALFDQHEKVAISVIHAQASVSHWATVSAGAYVGAFAFVGPRSSIGMHAIVNVGSSVGHGATVGDFSQLCPGVRISGSCRVGIGAFLGSNSVLGPGATMGDWAKLGACSYAHRAVPSARLAVGVPARVVL